MFSMENRRGAVDLCFTEGMTIRKVVAELGYLSEDARAKDRPRSCAQAWQFLSKSLMGVAFSALYVQNAAFQNGVLAQNTAFQSRVWCKMSCKW
ncbi:hypothetical protein GS08_03185 [Bifidobacterium longum]|jgi:hypothetical protein|uniref:Uncharacterized protein n=2 Tax=Bifidobacterium longum TaxID=216816 RepID=A0A7U4H521_BIFLN|nr:hypothetical protein GS08_03185 [Bifidobacterium longum]